MCLMKNLMITKGKYYEGIIYCPGDEIRKRTLFWEPPLLLPPLAAREPFPFLLLFLSYNFYFPPKVTSTITVNACHQLQTLLINSCASVSTCFVHAV